MNGTIEVSACCKSGLVEDFRENFYNPDEPFEIYTCAKCKQECEVEVVCEFCEGTGEVAVYECNDSTGYNHIVSDTKPCLCQQREEERDRSNDE